MKKFLCLAAAVLVCGGASAQEMSGFDAHFKAQKMSVPMRNNLGAKLVKADGTAVPAESLSGKMIGLFFSGSWTDLYVAELKKLYADLQAKGEPFEVVWVSNDLNAQDMMKFMKEQNMPWPAVQFDRLQLLNLRFQYGVHYDPTLIIINAPGAPFAQNALKDMAMLGGVQAYEQWKALRPIPFEGQSEVAGDFPPVAPVSKEPLKMSELLGRRTELAGDVVELEYTTVHSAYLAGVSTYKARLGAREGAAASGAVEVEVSEAGYNYLEALVRRGEQRRTVYVQVTHPGFPLRALGTEYSKKHNAYSWE